MFWKKKAPACEKTMEKQALADRLFAAAHTGDAEAIRLLALDGADLDHRNYEGLTALHIASRYGHRDAINALLAARPTGGVRGETGLT